MGAFQIIGASSLQLFSGDLIGRPYIVSFILGEAQGKGNSSFAGNLCHPAKRLKCTRKRISCRTLQCTRREPSASCNLPYHAVH